MSKRRHIVIHSDARPVILKIYNYLSHEYYFMKGNNKDKIDLSPLSNIRVRTAEGAGVAQRTVTTILKEAKGFTGPTSKFRTRRYSFNADQAELEEVDAVSSDEEVDVYLSTPSTSAK